MKNCVELREGEKVKNEPERRLKKRKIGAKKKLLRKRKMLHRIKGSNNQDRKTSGANRRLWLRGRQKGG